MTATKTAEHVKGHEGETCPTCKKCELDSAGDCPLCDPRDEDWDEEM